jgi:hypothetical protein
VDQAVATAVLDPGIGAKRLVGYVVAAGVAPAAVVAHCRSLLVPAMVPSAIVALDSFPLLPNGKIDMNGLPLPDWGSLQEEEVEYVEPANETERRIRDLWLEVRGCRCRTLESFRLPYFAVQCASFTWLHLAHLSPCPSLAPAPLAPRCQVLGRKEPVSSIADFLTVGGTSMLVSGPGLTHVPGRLLSLCLKECIVGCFLVPAELAASQRMMLLVWSSLPAIHTASTTAWPAPFSLAPSNPLLPQVIRLASAIQMAFGLSSPLNRLHELSTIQQMAAYVAEVAAEDAGTVALAPRQWPDAQLRPASLGQEQVRRILSWGWLGA